MPSATHQVGESHVADRRHGCDPNLRRRDFLVYRARRGPLVARPGQDAAGRHPAKAATCRRSPRTRRMLPRPTIRHSTPAPINTTPPRARRAPASPIGNQPAPARSCAAGGLARTAGTAFRRRPRPREYTSRAAAGVPDAQRGPTHPSIRSKWARRLVPRAAKGATPIHWRLPRARPLSARQPCPRLAQRPT